MSEPKLISPLLASHVMGDPISEHDGVRCCPAMNTESEEKYIVKIISIPASQVQVDALLLSGAFGSREDAGAYFKDLCNQCVQEAELLQKLSRLEGFAGYEAWQAEPMEDGTGYDVYLLGAYRRTLERQLRMQPLTHLGGVNLGLDLCAALSVCRRNGYLYADLKPENVFLSDNGEFLIGDLGFIALDSLKYASLPDRYRSDYTAPEITDAYSSLNETLDVYALGLILYQVFSGGQLPPADAPAPAPAYADAELSEIILKACARKPEDRWQDPMQMGQALVSYMQRNTVNDTPVIPEETDVPEETAEPETEEAEEGIENTEDLIRDVDEAIAKEDEKAAAGSAPPEQEAADDAGDSAPSDDTEAAEPSDEEEPGPSADDPESEASAEPVPEEVSGEKEEEVPEAADTAQSPPGEAAPEPEQPEVIPEETAEGTPEPEATESGQLVLDGFPAEEPEEDTENPDDSQVHEDVSAILAQADELIAHQLPDPVVAPEPVDVPIPPLPAEEPETEADSEEETDEEAESASPEPEEADAQDEPDADPEEIPSVEEHTEAPEPVAPRPKKKHTGLIVTLVTVLVLLLLSAGAFLFYENYYLQAVDGITLRGEENHLTVLLDTQIDNSILTVVCTDTYGNTLRQSVTDNTAEFTGLNPGTNYKITVEAGGFHKLVGTTAASYATKAQTVILNFTAVAGDSDGSVILNFSVHGPDNSAWLIKYSAPGTEEKIAQCTGHMATITDLEIGKKYTFRLEPVADLYVVDNNPLEFTASKVITAENLKILGFHDGNLEAEWSAPEGVAVESWTVRCYNNKGFDKTVTVSEPKVVFEKLNPADGYTIDVKAAGMSVSKQVNVSANSVTFQEILIDSSQAGQLLVTWNYEGNVPEGGWRLLYTVDGSEKQLIQTDKNTCVIPNVVPGAHYEFWFELPEGLTVFNGTASFDAPEAKPFEGYKIKGEDIIFVMCRTPENPNWNRWDIPTKDYVSSFQPGEKASFVLQLNKHYSTSADEIPTLFVVRNEKGVPVSITAGRTRTWTNMWYKGFCCLDMPVTPQVSGNYTVDIYFSGAPVTSYPFIVV